MQNKNKKQSSVTKPHNAIIDKFQMTAREQDLVTLAFMEVRKFADRTKVVKGEFDPNRPETLEKIETIFQFKAKDVADLLGVTVKALNIKDENGSTFLCNVCEKLISRRAKIDGADKSFLVANLISEASFTNNVLTLEVTRSQAARMLDYGLNNNSFGLIDAKLLLGFKSGYTKRIFEIISRFKNSKEFTTTVGELCEMLGTSLDEHADFARFKRNVLDRSLAQIIAKSDGSWSFKDVDGKKGRGYVVLDTVRGRKVSKRNRIVFKMQHNEIKKDKKRNDEKPLS